jgi:Flp pilus assembly protein TadG
MTRSTLRTGVLRRFRADGGGVTAMVAALLGAGVLIGMVALVVDVGRLYAEREELQSGAEAAALAVAQSCVRTPASCNTTRLATAGKYANKNASDGVAGVTTVCGKNSGGTLPTCPANDPSLAACIGNKPTADYAEVRTHTVITSGSTLLPPVFAQGLLGNQGYAGSKVSACSRAHWGPPEKATTVSISIPMCLWESASHDGTYTHDPENVQLRHTGGDNCPGPGNPDGFGWMPSTPGYGPCQTVVDLTAPDPREDPASYPGNGSFDRCKSTVQNAVSSGTPVLVSVYDGLTFDKSYNPVRKLYRMVGMAEFVIVGYKNLPGIGSDPHGCDCTGSDSWFYGYFVNELIHSTGTVGTGPNLGASVVSLRG